MYVCITFSILSFCTNFPRHVKNILFTSSGWVHDRISPFTSITRFSLKTWSLCTVSIFGFRAFVNLFSPSRSLRKAISQMLFSSFIISPMKNLLQLLKATATNCPMLVSYKNINFKFIHTVIEHKVYWICSVKSTLFVLPFLIPTIICWF